MKRYLKGHSLTARTVFPFVSWAAGQLQRQKTEKIGHLDLRGDVFDDVSRDDGGCVGKSDGHLAGSKYNKYSSEIISPIFFVLQGATHQNASASQFLHRASVFEATCFCHR